MSRNDGKAKSTFLLAFFLAVLTAVYGGFVSATLGIPSAKATVGFGLFLTAIPLAFVPATLSWLTVYVVLLKNNLSSSYFVGTIIWCACCFAASEYFWIGYYTV